MSASSGRHFFISYSRTDTTQKQNIIKQLRARGINLWVDIENLVPGSPAWEREIERAIRDAAGIIVLLSPNSNNSEWVRREISFAQQNDKQIFPVLIRGEEDDSVPLRLSNHQWVDLRTDSDRGLDRLADALKDQLGVTVVNKKMGPQKKEPIQWLREDLRKFAVPGLLVLIAFACIDGLVLLGSIIRKNIPTQSATMTATMLTTVLDGDPKLTVTAGASEPAPDLSGKSTRLTDFKSMLGVPEISPDNHWIVFTNRVDNFDQIWLMDRDGDNVQMIFSSEGNAAVAPTWSPDSKEILFALGKDLSRQLYIMGFDGREPRLISDNILTPGRTDWSTQNMIAYFIGDTWQREVWTMYPDSSDMVQVTDGGNAQSPSFSPGGRYIAFTAYTDVDGRDELSCEIFVMNPREHSASRHV